MARIILKSPYLKPNSKTHIANYVRYIATRDGVEKVDESKKYLPATQKQKQLIDKLLRSYSDTSDLYELKDYKENPTRENADELIMRIAEMHGELLGDREKYVSYIAQRPRVEKLSSHGLFTDDGVPIILSEVAKEVSESQSNIWTHIISLQREDAERLGYDNADAWMQLLRSQRNMIAQSMKIAPENFRWFAAFHNESHHPHVHMIAFSADPKEAYLTEKGIRSIKESLAREIFRQDMISVYQKQTEHRDALRLQSRDIIADIVERINSGGYHNPNLETLLLKLANNLSGTSGKKVYGYLNSDLKKLVDDIVDELSEDERISELYDLWYHQREEILSIYTDELPPRVPLSQNEEFRPIKNAVIREAMNPIINQPSVHIRYKYGEQKQSAAIASLRLLQYLAQIIQDKIYNEQENNDAQIDRKLKRAIDEKKQAWGLKQ